MLLTAALLHSGLNDVVVQFTIARGAAQRVFEMLDALPDVDLDAGVKLNKHDIRGTFVPTPFNGNENTQRQQQQVWQNHQANSHTPIH